MIVYIYNSFGLSVSNVVVTRVHKLNVFVDSHISCLMIYLKRNVIVANEIFQNLFASKRLG